MNNKEGKTFSDLFMKSQDDEEVVNNEKKVTFDSFSDILVEDENDGENSNKSKELNENNASSFNNIFNVASNEIENEKNIVVNDNVDSNEVSFSDMFNLGENIKEVDKVDIEIQDEIISDKPEEVIVQEDTNIFDISDDTTGENQEEVVEDKKEEVIVQEDTNIFGIGDDTSVDNQEEIVEDKKEEVIVQEDTNIFGIGDDTTGENHEEIVEDKKEEVIVQEDTNIFGIGDDTTGENQEEVVEDKKEEVKIVEVTNNSNDIPADLNGKIDNNGDLVVDSPLFNEMININEVDNVKKNVDKLDLSNTKNFEVKVVPKKEPLIKVLIGIISYAFFIWLLFIGIALLAYVLDIKIRAARGDYSTPTFNAYVVLTGSMLPEIQVNDVVITKKVPAEDLKKGDIITFSSVDSRFANTIITHRIIKKNPAVNGSEITFQTKGDNNNVADSALVPASRVYGKVILKIPMLGYLQEFLATDGGWIIVVLIPCLTVISYDIVKISKKLKKKKYNNIKLKK